MFRKRQGFIEVGLFFVVAAVLYLPFARQFGYYNDDWYSMYSARVAGAEIFKTIYGFDRPARAFLMMPLYMLFKGVPFYYSLSAYVLRIFGALSFLWLLRLLWRDRKNESFLAALLFLIYPGFLNMPTAIDFQSHLLAMVCAMLSLGLTITFVDAQTKLVKWLSWLGAVLLGWVYLSQMEYYIGFELVRIAVLVLLFLRQNSWKKVLLPLVKRWVFFAIIPVGFVFWRQFMFDNQRKVTELGAQFGKLLTDPLFTLYEWIVNAVQSLLNVMALSWAEPLHRLGFSLSTGKFLIALTLSVSVMGVIFAFFHFVDRNDPIKDERNNWSQEAFWLGAIWVICGLLPVILANRSVSLLYYSRYGFVSSVGAVLLLALALTQLKLRYLQMPMLGFLILSSVFTHYGNAFQHAEASNDLRDFWWQVSWRVPQFEEGTTLVANYPHGNIRESSFVWGPANFVYYPEPEWSEKKIDTGIFALVLNRDMVARIQVGEAAYLDQFFTVYTVPDPGDILIITQPSPDSCVQVIDGSQPVYSVLERETIRLVGEYSDSSHILLDADFNEPPAFLFGDEPKHGWCYFYEKAALARQRGDWDEVYALDAVASQQGSVAKDQIEWMPFLQSHIIFNDIERLTKVAREIKNNHFVRDQACGILMGMPEISAAAAEIVDVKICYLP